MREDNTAKRFNIASILHNKVDKYIKILLIIVNILTKSSL